MESPVCAHTSARESGTRPTTTQLVHSQIKRKNNNKMEMHCPTSFFLAQSLNVRGNAVLDAVWLKIGHWRLFFVVFDREEKISGKSEWGHKATKKEKRNQWRKTKEVIFTFTLKHLLRSARRCRAKYVLVQLTPIFYIYTNRSNNSWE